jgi:hypothetical protein
VPPDALIYCDLINANTYDGRPDVSLIEEADRLFPDNVGILWFGALDAEARGSHAQVVERIDRLLATTTVTPGGDSLVMDKRVVGEWAFHLRGMARFKIGDKAGAVRDFAAAEACDPDNAEYRVKRQLAEFGL